MKLYAVGCLIQEKKVRVFGQEASIALSWADSMIGIMPVFDTSEAAREFAGDRFNVIEYEVE